MSKHTMDARGTTGYFLPEESHFRLKKLHGHMEFLSQLAQPRRDDEEDTGFGPEISGDEMAVCLELLAEQAGRVLDEVTWPAERKTAAQRSQARGEDDLDDRAEAEEAEEAEDAEEADEALDAEPQDDEAGELPPANAQEDADSGTDEASGAGDADADATADPLVIGMTMDQLDALNRLHDRLHAYGDMVLGLERMTLADGTPTVLGEVIFEDAEAASKLMDQVAGQCLPDELRGTRGVREAHAAYGAPGSHGPNFDSAMPRLPPPVPAGGHPQGASLH
ncbi:XAC0095 family protein [Luteimonas kalidii]|uniref:XAC0095-like domain-containing protein n=1 Tax=Luteimonas kalidii TaxID=3042025 RepID=A0ABT6JTW2_9GAMM|nr:hypothetical protein [Luteimonas kalidii]MDH5833391.1 hypothetical protein [Luteimonas kalidii]